MIIRVQRGYNNGGGCILNILSKKKKIEIIICLIRERDNGGGWVGV